MSLTYVVETLRSGQPRPYADTEHEYLITITYTPAYGKDRTPRPWVPTTDTEESRKWAKTLVRTLCQNFREHGDNDGRTDMDAYFYPTLKSLVIDPATGTVRTMIVTPFTD